MTPMEKPRLSFWQIWNMSFGFMGIQFGWALQMANMSAIYQMLGAEESEIALYWLAAPVTGFIVQPIIGYFSDRTWNRLGRRRPYFLVGAILASAALVVMPHSSALWMAAGLLWILDASINVSMEPFRAFVADKLPTEQRNRGYAVQSLMIGAGSVLASSLPWLLTSFFDVAATAPEGGIPDAVRLAFYLGAAAFFLAVVWTVVSTKEEPPPDMQAFRRMKADSAGVMGFFRELGHGLANMPTTMRQLAAVQFFTWMGLFCMWIHYSPAIARNVFGAVPGTTQYAGLVAEAGQWTGVSFSIYNAVCFVFAFFLVWLTQFVSARRLHMSCLAVGGGSLFAVGFISDQYLLIVPMVGVGIAWASILSMPYALLSHSLPAERMGFYMGVFNFFIVLPQIAVAVGLQSVMNALDGITAVHVVMGGGLAMLLAAVLMLRVHEPEQSTLSVSEAV